MGTTDFHSVSPLCFRHMCNTEFSQARVGLACHDHTGNRDKDENADLGLDPSPPAPTMKFHRCGTAPAYTSPHLQNQFPSAGQATYG